MRPMQQQPLLPLLPAVHGGSGNSPWLRGLAGFMLGMLSAWLLFSDWPGTKPPAVWDQGHPVQFGISRNFKTAAAQNLLPQLQQRAAQAELEQRWELNPPPRGRPAGAPASSPLRIPRILHHVFVPGLPAFTQLTQDLSGNTRQRWGQSCVLQHLGWDYVFWDLQAADQLIDRHYSGFKQMWASMSSINRANVLRYFILHSMGGLYLDLDVECWRAGEHWLAGADVVLQGSEQGLAPGVLAGVPGHPLWAAAIHRMHATSKQAQDLTHDVQGNMTGHTLLEEALLSLGPQPSRRPNNPWVGRHQLAKTTVVVHPMGHWFLPCPQGDAACHQQTVRQRALGAAPLSQLAGYHRYSASWLAGGNPAGIHSMRGLETALCGGHSQQKQQLQGQQQAVTSHWAGRGAAAVPGTGAPHAAPRPLLPIRSRRDIAGVLEQEGLRTGAELGVQLGIFAEKTLSVWRSCRRYYLVDAWRQQENYDDMANVGADEQERRYQATRARLAPFSSKTVFLRNYTTEAAQLVPDLSLDYLYIDARHDYCGVKEDLTTWWPKLRRGGILSGHDYHTAAEVWAMAPPFKQDWSLCQDGRRHEGAVKGAVDEFALAHGLTLLITYAEHFPSWMARKP